MSDIDNIKAKLDIVDVISRYIELKPAGSNFRALSPFKQEKTPSFMVSPKLQIYKDFSSGKGGDLITFIKEYERLTFREALEKAAEMAGVELSGGNYTKDKELEEKKDKIYKANDLTAKFYHHILKTHNLGQKGRDYAQKRNIGKVEIEKFMFGYAPSGYHNLEGFLKKRGFSENELIEFGLLVVQSGRVIDKFRNRLMQPIFDLNGKIVGFSGRYIGISDKAPKYLNSPETIVYKKKELPYGLYQAADSARKERSIIIVEGNLDVVSSHRVGVENVVAPLGTAFTENQATLLKRFVDTLYFCFDSDSAGINALIRAIPIVENIGLRHKVVDLQPYKDNDDLITKEPEEWKVRIANAKNTIEHIITLFTKDLDLGSVDGKTTFHSRIIPILRTLKDEVEISHFIKQVSILLEISQETLLKEVKLNEKPQKIVEQEIKSVETTGTQDNLEKYLLALLVQYPQQVPIDINENVFLNAENKELFLVFKEVSGEISSALIPSLSENIARLLEEVSLIDTSKIEKKGQDLIIEIYKRLYKDYLKREILHIRKQLSVDDENPELLGKLNETMKQLKDY